MVVRQRPKLGKIFRVMEEVVRSDQVPKACLALWSPFQRSIVASSKKKCRLGSLPFREDSSYENFVLHGTRIQCPSNLFCSFLRRLSLHTLLSIMLDWFFAHFDDLSLGQPIGTNENVELMNWLEPKFRLRALGCYSELRWGNKWFLIG